MADLNQPLFGTSGAKPTEEGQQAGEWILPKTIALAKIVDVVTGASSQKGSPFLKIIIMAENDPSTKPNDYGAGKLCETNQYWYSSEGAATMSNNRLANFREVFKTGEMSGTDLQSLAADVKAKLVGKVGYFLIGGKESDKGTVYSKVYDWDFVAPGNEEGRIKMQKRLEKEFDRLIEKYSPATGGGSTTKPSAALAPELPPAGKPSDFSGL